MVNAETPDSACGNDLWKKIRDRWRARRAERETKTHQTAAWWDEGRRDDGGHQLGAEGNCQGCQQEHGREATQRGPQDSLRPVSASTGSQRRSLHVLDDQASGARVQENKGVIARLLGIGGDQETRPWSTTNSGLHGPAASAVGERQHSVSSKRGTIWNRRGHSIWYLFTSCQSVRSSSEPSRTRHQRGTTPRTHSWGTGTDRSESSSRSSSKRSFGTGIVSSDRTELKKVNFVAASRPDSPIRLRERQVDWREGIASDKELMDREKMVGTGGSAVSSKLGQLLTSVKIEEVRGLSSGALDQEFDAEEDAAREMYSQSDL